MSPSRWAIGTSVTINGARLMTLPFGPILILIGKSEKIRQKFVFCYRVLCIERLTKRNKEKGLNIYAYFFPNL